MVDPSLGQHHFFSWVRRGLGLAVATVDDATNPADARPILPVDVSVNAKRAGAVVDTKHAGTNVKLYGPGDVIGIDPRHIVRTEPRHLTANFEPNYFAGMEFDQLDFPWLFTPAKPSGDRLRPWLALIVLKATEFQQATEAPTPLPRIVVTDLSALPDLADSWAWTHGQVSGDIPADGLESLIRTAPSRAVSRVLCPRQLDPDTRYFAFLVPAFEPGRLAGLGLDTSAAPKAIPSWPATGAGSYELPYYYTFEFTTSDRGDFESLVRALKPRIMPPEVGIRAMDVSEPAQGFPSAGPPLGLGGALRSPLTLETPWNDPSKTDFQTQLVDLINRTSPTLDDPDNPLPHDPAVVPPIYGRWHAGVTAVDRAAAGWVHELNLDPRTRGMAGLGTRVVDEERVHLLASAWQQVAGIELANQLRRQAQMARGAMVESHKKHFLAATDSIGLMLTQPVLNRILASPRTVHATLAESKLPVRALSPPFRRIARPLGPLRRRQLPGGVASGDVIAKLSTGSISPVPPPHPPGGMVSIDDISDRLYPPWLPAWLRRFLTYAFWLLIVFAILLAILLVLFGLALGLITVAAATAAVAVLVALAVTARFQSGRWQLAGAVRLTEMTPAAIAAVPGRPTYKVVAAGQPAPPPAGTGADSQDAVDFRLAAGDLTRALHQPLPDPPPPPEADLGSLRATVMNRLDPTFTVPARLLATVKISPQLNWRSADPIAPVMAYPVFDQAMYEPLRDLGQDYLLPGLELIPPDTLTLLETNEAFVEAYMVGLNHEMARQLLWAEYPTDQRGSYFRQFWSVRAYVPTPTDPTDPAALTEKLRDIKRIPEWNGGLLGGNSNRADITPGNLVLLVRGELLRRYPNAVIYACQAVWDGEGHPRELSDIEIFPLFRGTLNPDLTFFGFNLTEDQARGGARDAGESAGWFFVFQQQAFEARFGFEPVAKDPVTSWAEVAWSDFGFVPVSPDAPTFATPQTPAQNLALVSPADLANQWNRDSAQTAYIAYRRPARIAIHADLMLPKAST
jgi:hypothetical protein